MDCLTLKKANCHDCHKCIRYCPVKSIRFSDNQAYIIGNECILCGRCYLVCPQDAGKITDHTDKVRAMIASDAPVIASLDPSFVAYYKGFGMASMRNALQALGFYDVQTDAMGAALVANEYQRRLQEGECDNLITSSCHSVNLLIQKHFPQLLPMLAPVLSPMQAQAQHIKRQYPDAKAVFIGPCIAKKHEASTGEGWVDAVLTFEELSDWLKAEQIELTACEESGGEACLFPFTGGILRSMKQRPSEYTYMAVDGADDCIEALKELAEGNVHHCVLELSACEGGCIGGPVMRRFAPHLVGNYIAVSKAAGEMPQPPAIDAAELHKSFKAIKKETAEPTEEQIRSVLWQMGKTSPAREINCGSCGYNTCRERAIAVCLGKSGTEMCMPYLKEKAERFSDNIVHSTPTVLLVLNEALEVQQLNEAALDMFGITSADEVVGKSVEHILDPADFEQVLGSGSNIDGQRFYLSRQKKYVEETIVYDEDSRLLICMLHDVTGEETEREKKQMISRYTVEIADSVVDKQMRVVQEIASLLGETVAETKIALTKLKESIIDE